MQASLGRKPCRVVSGVRMRPAQRFFVVAKSNPDDVQPNLVEKAASAARSVGKATMAGVAAAALVRIATGCIDVPICAMPWPPRTYSKDTIHVPQHPRHALLNPAAASSTAQLRFCAGLQPGAGQGGRARQAKHGISWSGAAAECG